MLHAIDSDVLNRSSTNGNIIESLSAASPLITTPRGRRSKKAHEITRPRRANDRFCKFAKEKLVEMKEYSGFTDHQVYAQLLKLEMKEDPEFLQKLQSACDRNGKTILPENLSLSAGSKLDRYKSAQLKQDLILSYDDYKVLTSDKYLGTVQLASVGSVKDAIEL